MTCKVEASNRTYQNTDSVQSLSSNHQVSEEEGLVALVTMENHGTVLENGDLLAAQQASDITFSSEVGPSTGLRRKQLLWQNAVRNVINQHNLYSLRLAGGLERGRHRITVTDAYIADINRYRDVTHR